MPKSNEESMHRRHYRVQVFTYQTANYVPLKDYEPGSGFKGDTRITRAYYDDPERLSPETEYDVAGNAVKKHII